MSSEPYSFDQFKLELALLQRKVPELELKEESAVGNPFLLKELSLWGSFERKFEAESQKVREGLTLQFDIVFDTTNSLPGLFFRAHQGAEEVKEPEKIFKNLGARVDLKPHPIRKFNPQTLYLHECQLNEILEKMENKLEAWFSTVFSEVFGVYITM